MQKNLFKTILGTFSVVLSLAACTQKSEQEIEQVQASSEEVTSIQPKSEAFDSKKIPLSHADLGDFPFFALPVGYETRQAITLPLNRTPYWNGTKVEWVEGALFSAGIQPQKDNSQASFIEIERAITQQIQKWGGHEVTFLTIPKEQIQSYPKEFLSKFYYGLGNIYQYPVHVFMIRQPKQTIWIQLTQNNDQSAGLLISKIVDQELTVKTASAFPYIQFPQNYHYVNEAKKTQMKAPIWNGQSWQWVEGQFFAAGVEAKKDELGSSLELTRYFQALMKELDAVEYAKSPIKAEQISPEMKQFMGDYYHATRGIYSSELQVFKREKDGVKTWFMYAETSGEEAGLWVVEEKKHEVETGPLLANDLKKQLNQNNSVNIQIHFDTNQAKILATSKSQMDQIFALLSQNPDLKLYVYGHTDNTGLAKTNVILSEARANAVVQALVELGIEPKRLLAKGFGGENPIASNTTLEGKAQNRRVELVKQP